MPRPAAALLGRCLELPSGSVHVREDGHDRGNAIVLVHGFASSMHAYDRLTPLLARDAWVIRVDLLGHGESVGRAADVGPAAQAVMLSEVVAALGASDVIVVGHSFGADVAIDMARRDAAVRAVVVVAQAPDYTGARLPRGSRLVRRGSFAAAAGALTPGWALRRTARFAFAPGVRYLDLLDRPDRLAIDIRATSPAVYSAVLVDRPRDLSRRPLDVRLRDWGGPALVVLGDRDQLYPVGPTRDRYAAVPGVRVEIVRGSGHSPPLERPDATAASILGFARSA